MGLASVPVQILTWVVQPVVLAQGPAEPADPALVLSSSGEMASCWRENWLVYLGTASQTPMAGR